MSRVTAIKNELSLKCELLSSRPFASLLVGASLQIADGMTVEVDTVTVTVETRGGSRVTGHDTAMW